MKTMIIGIIVVALIFAVGIFFCPNNYKTKGINSMQDIKNNVEKYVLPLGRKTHENNGVVYIGNNLQELENGFYDISFQLVDNRLIVNVNKLWYNTPNENKLEYLACLLKIINISDKKVGDKIIKDYEIVKQNGKYDMNKITDTNIIIFFYSVKNELIIEVDYARV